MKGKTFDIVEYVKFIYGKKILLMVCMLISVLLALFYFKACTNPIYVTEIQVKLPQHCADRDIFTAIEIANGDLIQKSVVLISDKGINDYDESEYDKINVKADWVRNTPIISVKFRDSNEAILKKFIPVYEKQLVEELNSMVSERFLREIQLNAVRNDNIPANMRDFKKDYIIGEVKVIKSATKIEGPIQVGTVRKYFMAGLVGLFAGFFLFSFQFLLKQFKA